MGPQLKFRFVCATRVGRDEFFEKTALGRSLALYNAPFVDVALFDNNTRGLPAIYNEAVRQSSADPAVLIFSHDDVHLCDFFWAAHVLNGLKMFDIVGVAGNARRLPGQPAWCFTDATFTWDTSGSLSGSVAHGIGFPPANLSRFGPPGRAVKLLDGCFLGVHSETLRATGLSFDETFDFHFYDMDFCRQAESKGLRMGTCATSTVHESPGGFGTAAWQENYRKYLGKWTC